MFAQLRRLEKKYSWIWRSGWPFQTSREASGIERLRILALIDHLRARPAAKWVMLYGVMTLTWPFTAMISSFRAVRRDRARGDSGLLRRFIRYYQAAMLHSAMPEELQRLHAMAGLEPDAAPQLMYNPDSRVWIMINRARGANPEDVQDKARFFQICQREGISTVPVIAAFAGGHGLLPIDHAAAAGRSLFVKSLRGQRGDGAGVWQWSETGYSDGTDHHASLDALLGALAAQDCIIQPQLRDSPALAAFAAEGLSSLRLVTLCTATGEARPVGALFQVARGMLSQAGDVFGIDIATGAIQSHLHQLENGKRVRLPGGGDCPLSTLPGWSEIVAQTCAAHARGFPRFSTLGWDVVITDTGVHMLEANQGWAIMPHQLLDLPMGQTAIGEVAREWLAEAAGLIRANTDCSASYS